MKGTFAGTRGNGGVRDIPAARPEHDQPSQVDQKRSLAQPHDLSTNSPIRAFAESPGKINMISRALCTLAAPPADS